MAPYLTLNNLLKTKGNMLFVKGWHKGLKLMTKMIISDLFGDRIQIILTIVLSSTDIVI